MKTIATLDPSLRLVVFQFLMRTSLVSSTIPLKNASNAPPMPSISGIEVFKSTPGLCLLPLAKKIIFPSGNYEFVDAWKKPHETNWKIFLVRFVFCHKKHVNWNELFPWFIVQKAGLEDVFTNLVSENLWAVQGHLNPYFENGNPSGHQVLMFGCAGRVPNTEVFSGGRDENNRGVGPKALLSTLAQRLDLAGNKRIVLRTPESVPETVSAPVA